MRHFDELIGGGTVHADPKDHATKIRQHIQATGGQLIAYKDKHALEQERRETVIKFVGYLLFYVIVHVGLQDQGHHAEQAYGQQGEEEFGGSLDQLAHQTRSCGWGCWDLYVALRMGPETGRLTQLL